MPSKPDSAPETKRPTTETTDDGPDIADSCVIS